MPLHAMDTLRAECLSCGRRDTIAALALHDCQIEEQGGRCEDYPCCGHTDGDGCQTLPQHTSDFYARNPHLLHEPGSPEWYDAMDDLYGDEPEDEPELGPADPDCSVCEGGGVVPTASGMSDQPCLCRYEHDCSDHCDECGGGPIRNGFGHTRDCPSYDG